jgi:adenosine deaminase
VTEAGDPAGARPPDWFERVPKVELHVHLEGAIPLDTLWTLVLKYGGDPAVPDREALGRAFAYRDFPHFLETWVWKNRFLREYEDFTFIAEAVARDFEAQNIRYAEAFFSPPDFAEAGLEAPRLAEAVRRGLDRVPGARVALVADLVRDFGPAAGDAFLSELAEIRDLGIVGIGIGGTEGAFPPGPFAPVYARARRLGFRTSVHAGEGAGPESVREALRRLRPDRIGHATRAAEDPALVDELAASRVPLELCPMSNVRTGVVRALAEHPVRRYFDRGLAVSVNTDDPQMFGTRLADEYRLLTDVHAFTRDEIRSLIRQAAAGSWLGEADKSALLAELEADPAWGDDDLTGGGGTAR